MAFTWFDKFSEALRGLPDDQRRALEVAIVEYGAFGTVPDFSANPLMGAVFGAFREDIDNSVNSHASKRQAARTRWQAPASCSAADVHDAPASCTNTSQDNTDQVKSSSPPSKTSEGSRRARGAKRGEARGEKSGRVSGGSSPPDVEEVAAYCRERGHASVNPARFVEYYAGRGWTSGGRKIENWRALCDRWAESGGGPASSARGAASVPAWAGQYAIPTALEIDNSGAASGGGKEAVDG